MVEDRGTNIRTTNYYLNSQNKFIVALSKDTVGVTLRLVSDLVPLDETLSHAFDIAFHSSRSMAARAPFQGTLHQTQANVTFSRVPADLPSVRILGEDTLYTTAEGMKLTVDYRLPEGYALSLAVLRKAQSPDGKTSEYTNTGQVVSDLMNDQNYWRPYATVANKATLTVPLAGHQNGSFCLVITVIDQTGARIMEIPYYFVIYDS